MHSFLLENILFETKHLEAMFVHHTRLFFENGPEVKCPVLPFGAPAAGGSGGGPRLPQQAPGMQKECAPA